MEGTETVDTSTDVVEDLDYPDTIKGKIVNN